jgi:hypothetical protein
MKHACCALHKAHSQISVLSFELQEFKYCNGPINVKGSLNFCIAPEDKSLIDIIK